MTKNHMHVLFILDKSGSMSSVRESTISGFNEYLKTLRNDRETEYTLTVTLFDTMMERYVSSKPLESVEPLSEKTYCPGGNTALYDAACTTILAHEEGKEKKLVVIITDGEENASQKYTQDDFKRLVTRLTIDGWKFVYLGANQDAWANAQKYGFSAQSVASFNSTVRGTQNAFSNVAVNTVAYAASASTTADFFSEEDQAELKNIK